MGENTRILEKVEMNGGWLIIYDPSDLPLDGCPSAFRSVVFYDALGNEIWQIDGREGCNFLAGKRDTIIGIRNYEARTQLVTFKGYFF